MKKNIQKEKPTSNIPKFISKVPWYHDNNDNDNGGSSGSSGSDGGASSKKDGDEMGHQNRKKIQKTPLSHHHEKGQTERKSMIWLEGSCSNCGSRTHGHLDCLEGPRIRGAIVSRENLGNDDWVKNAKNLDWDAKRDRWATFKTEDTANMDKKSKKLKENPFKLVNIDTSLRQREDRASYLDDDSNDGDDIFNSVKTEFVSHQKDSFSWEIKKEKTTITPITKENNSTTTLPQHQSNKVDPSLLDGY